MRTPKQCFGARRGLASQPLWLADRHRPASRPSLRNTNRFAVTLARAAPRRPLGDWMQ